MSSRSPAIRTKKFVVANDETTGDCMNAAFVWDTSSSGSPAG